MIEKKGTQTWKYVTDFYTQYHLRIEIRQTATRQTCW